MKTAGMKAIQTAWKGDAPKPGDTLLSASGARLQIHAVRDLRAERGGVLLSVSCRPGVTPPGALVHPWPRTGAA